MVNIPGYTLRGLIKSTGANLLFHAVRDADGLALILKTPLGAAGPREAERYRREFGILQRLREVPGITRVHAHEQGPDRPMLLLEEVEGEPLSELTGQPLEAGRVLELGICLASTLAELHRHGVIHKDIKPSNIIVTRAGATRLIDFGTATLQLVEHVEAAPAPLIEGTLAYMSPEQTGRMNRSVDYRTDLYSLGITLYEVLTGSRPFHGRDALGWFHAHMAQAPQPPHERVPGLPRVLSAIVLKLLAKVAEERYQSAEGLSADLERCRQNLQRGVHEAFPLGLHDSPPHFQLPQRLYGRDAHAASLLQSFERVARGARPELILVRGYSGIGKSAVVHELHKPVVRQRGLFLSGKFEQFQQAVPYATLAQAIGGLTRHLLAGSDEELASWRERLLEAWQGQGQLLVDVVPQLEVLTGKQPPVPQLSATEAQHRFNRVFRKFLGVLATPEHPLVIFLDDLQWADQASLRLLHHLLTHPETPPMLLIGAYRDNEVGLSHPLALALAELRKAGARVGDLQLEPLSLEEVRQLVADTLPGAGAQVVEPLSAMAREKTGGNPFFLLQFLRTLHQDGLVARAPQGAWRWQAEAVRARGYSDNVVDFMAGKLRQLPVDTVHLLRLAACVGNTFSRPLLSLIAGRAEASAVEQGLEPALQEGMVVRVGPEQYRFLHDRIQQAAHALMAEQERKAVHLSIGRLLLESLSAADLDAQLFDVVGQLNAGVELMETDQERHRAARLNAQAGWRARSSTAHRSAVTYFANAFALIPGNPWETDYELTFKLRLDQSSSLLMSGNAAKGRRLVEELGSQARTPTDKAAAYRLKSELHIVAGEVQEAGACLLEYLATLGMPMSSHPSWEEVEQANAEVWALLGDRPIESLVHLPPMTDPDMKAVMSVLGALFAPAYFTDRNLLILHLCRMICLSLRHGITDAGAHGCAWYGLVVGPTFKRYPEGYAFGRVACELVERHGFSTYQAKVLLCMELINYWTHPIASSLELAHEAFRHAVERGDLQSAAFGSNHVVVNRLVMGHDLEEVYQESVARLDYVRKAGFLDVQVVIHFNQRFVQQMRGLSPSFNSLNGEDFDEAAFEAGLTPNRQSSMRFWYWTLKMQSRFMCGAYQEAREAADRAMTLTWAAFGHIQFLDLHLFRALTLAACYPELSAQEQPSALEAIRNHQQQLAEWARHCPSTFHGPERLVSAELARLTGRGEEALLAYEDAYQSALQNGFIHRAALASELAARCWRERKVATLEESYARKAREAYRRWGAQGKVQQLDAQWPRPSDLLASEDTTTGTDSTRIDALTVVKAQQAISGEIVLERLAATLLQVAIENAGAQRGALLLPQGEKLSVVAASSVSPESTASLDEALLPWTVISYVRRTHEHVLIGDAAQPHSFSADPGLEHSRARSVLCLPLLRQGEFRGVLYLENTLASNAFTPDRHSLLGHLASQAAISVENARLYADVQRAQTALRQANDELEKRVEERTRELQQAQARLVNSARAAGMAEVATNVLHNVGNVLTSAVINLETMRDLVDDSHLERLKQVTTLLEERRDGLADFLTRDPRGSRLSGYLSALADELLQERATLQQDMKAMGKHIDHIRAIVQVQQAYARNTLITEECELSLLIEDALSIQLPALLRHGVAVTRELAPVPKVRLDKHRVLQILVNLISNAKNALNALPEDQRRMEVRLGVEGNTARIQVVDNGVGIAPEIRERIFFQGFTTREDGHGLGLHSSALAAKLLGGRLTLESPGPGKGATATLEIPLA